MGRKWLTTMLVTCLFCSNTLAAPNGTNETELATTKCMTKIDLAEYMEFSDQIDKEMDTSWTEVYLEELLAERILVPFGFLGSLMSTIVLFKTKGNFILRQKATKDKIEGILPVVIPNLTSTLF